MRALGRIQPRNVVAVRPQQQRSSRANAMANSAGEQIKQLVLPREAHMLISNTEVPSFIQRDDMMDQLYRWALIEAAEGGLRNFGMPMKVEPRYFDDTMWGFDIEILKEGVKKADLGVNFDGEIALKHEWVGRDQDTGMPRMEGDAQEVRGKMLEIWCVLVLGLWRGRRRREEEAGQRRSQTTAMQH